MGMLMDDISVVVLTTPILLPIIAKLGVDPVHYAAIVGVNTALGCITPPCAPVLYLSGRVGRLDQRDHETGTYVHGTLLDPGACCNGVHTESLALTAPSDPGLPW